MMLWKRKYRGKTSETGAIFRRKIGISIFLNYNFQGSLHVECSQQCCQAAPVRDSHLPQFLRPTLQILAMRNQNIDAGPHNLDHL